MRFVIHIWWNWGFQWRLLMAGRQRKRKEDETVGFFPLWREAHNVTVKTLLSQEKLWNSRQQSFVLVPRHHTWMSGTTTTIMCFYKKQFYFRGCSAAQNVLNEIPGEDKCRFYYTGFLFNVWNLLFRLSPLTAKTSTYVFFRKYSGHSLASAVLITHQRFIQTRWTPPLSIHSKLFP